MGTHCTTTTGPVGLVLAKDNDDDHQQHQPQQHQQQKLLLVEQQDSDNSINSSKGSNQYTEARRSLRSIDINSKHRNQFFPFALKLRLKKNQDEDRSLVFTKAAKEGNFAKVISVLASQKNDKDRQRVMNEARRRKCTPVETAAPAAVTATSMEAEDEHPKSSSSQSSSSSSSSNFITTTSCPGDSHSNNKSATTATTTTSSKDWYELTPLAIAALYGHSNVVEYLLRQGADPTLRGSPSDEEDYNAVEAARKGVGAVEKVIDSVLSACKQEELGHQLTATIHSLTTGILGYDDDDYYYFDEVPTTPLAMAQALVHKLQQARLCLALLESVESFWPRAHNYSSHFRKRTYTNKPTDIKALRVALDDISLGAGGTTSSSRGCGGILTTAAACPDDDALVKRLAGKFSSCRVLEGNKTNDDEESDGQLTENSYEFEVTTKKKKKFKKGKQKRKGRRHSDSFMLLHPMSSSVMQSLRDQMTHSCSSFEKAPAVYA